MSKPVWDLDLDSVAPAAQQLARRMQSEPHELDEIARARMERNLVEAWRARGAHAVPLPKARPALSRTLWVGSVAASCALGVVLALFLIRQSAGKESPGTDDVAHFDLVLGDGVVQSGSVVAGQVLESGKRGHIEVGVGDTRLDLAPQSRVRFERLDREELRLALVQGRVDVAFNPRRKGEQRLLVETSAARVVVVGTRFAVEADAARATRVSVTEGVVRVEPRRGTDAVLVRAGEEVTIPPLPQSAVSKQALTPTVIAKAASPEPTPDASPSTLARTRLTAKAEERARKAGRATAAKDREVEQRLEAARQQLLAGKHAAAREGLERMIQGTAPPSARVEALMLMAESYTAQGQVPRAAAAYRHAVDAAPRDSSGHNALFALARLLDRYTSEDESAAAAYREYLARAPHGALAVQARDALCRLSPSSVRCK
jgi:TolA-binding protein